VTEGITPEVVPHERLPDVVVSTAIVELPNINGFSGVTTSTLPLAFKPKGSNDVSASQ
jgi:hypothetical protein